MLLLLLPSPLAQLRLKLTTPPSYMRRLQANLAYLAQNAEKVPKPGQQMQPGPAIMSVPTSHPELAKHYTKLQELFPGWKGQASGQMKQSPGPQRVASNPGPPPNSAGLQPNWGQNAMQQSLQQAQQLAQQQPQPQAQQQPQQQQQQQQQQQPQ